MTFSPLGAAIGVGVVARVVQLDRQGCPPYRQGLHPWLVSAAPAGLLAEEFFERCGICRLPAAQGTQLSFEAVFSMVLTLAVDVALDTLQLGASHREGSVPRLPPELRCPLLFHPARRMRFQLLPP